jgi:hypothetical protein
MFKNYRSSTLLLLIIFLFTAAWAHSQTFTYQDSWDKAGFNLNAQNFEKLEITYSIETFFMEDVEVRGSVMKSIHLPASLIPNDEGAPDLAGNAQYIAIPQGARARLNVITYRTEIFEGIEVAPAPRIPLDTDNAPLFYQKDEQIYSIDAYYPAEPFRLSEQTIVRGVDVALLGITPFQYNPLKKELLVYRDIQLEVIFEGGSGEFGDPHYRSPWFDPILKNILLNEASLPAVNHTNRAGSRDEGFEYVIIIPDDPVFAAWADTLKNFRTLQGITTGIYTITEVGGNNVNTIENFIDNAYNTWDIPPVAFLIMADYGTTGNGILSPIWNSYCASDHIYADVNGNGMADVILARMTAQNETHLENMIGKIIEYETSPPTYESFYNPITALGWQTERWFQICSESIGGFFKHVKGKDPIRINEIYSGNPATDPWSTATNTSTILGVFGPSGLGYIPASPTELGNWSGGNATMINDAINAGAFIIQHRDHGSNTSWGEPAYNTTSMNGLSNEDPIFVFSINCLTGKYNWSSECFAEKFHRMEHGALGLTAASEVSYSFVNDTYVWGLYDYMWPEFLPQFGSMITEEYGMFPAFANAAAKYFLQQSSWPYNTSSKEVTYNLFHHHGCAFQTLYSEVPETLMVMHDNVLLTGTSSFTVTADSGAFIALSHNGEILGTAESDGLPQVIPIAPLVTGDVMDVVVTKQNYFRYHATVDVIPANMAYVVYDDYAINDDAGNGDGLLDYGESILLSLSLQNVGLVDAFGVEADLSSANINITMTNDNAFFGDIPSMQSSTVTDDYAFEVSPDIADGEWVMFEITATDGDSVWNSSFGMQAHAPVMQYVEFTIDDANGNGNGRLDPGETAEITVHIANTGSSEAYDVTVALSCSGKSYVTVDNGPVSVGDMPGGSNGEAVFSVTAAPETPGGFNALFSVNINAEMGISANGGFDIIVGQFSALILDLDPHNHSGPAMMEAFNDLDLIASYTTTFPEDLGMYRSVFVSLGVIFTGHQLTPAESARLVEYLNNGGKLYLEGRRTWYDNPHLPIHDKFNINVVIDTWFEYDFISGVDGTFTDGMYFEFDGSSPYNNYYMEPEGTAFTVLTSPNPDFGCVVAYDEGSYKTIGCSFEFGDLTDGNHPSTQKQLMFEYLNFFGDIVTGIPEPATGQAAFLGNCYPNPSGGTTTFSFVLNEEMQVSLDIFDITGIKVATLVNAKLPAGSHQVRWEGTGSDGHPLAKGIYLYRLSSDSVNTTKKLIIH